MKKPTIYLDTNNVSALHYDGTEIGTLLRRLVLGKTIHRYCLGLVLAGNGVRPW